MLETRQEGGRYGSLYGGIFKGFGPFVPSWSKAVPAFPWQCRISSAFGVRAVLTKVSIGRVLQFSLLVLSQSNERLRIPRTKQRNRYLRRKRGLPLPCRLMSQTNDSSAPHGQGQKISNCQAQRSLPLHFGLIAQNIKQHEIVRPQNERGSYSRERPREPHCKQKKTRVTPPALTWIIC